jgi:hypothetical protein
MDKAERSLPAARRSWNRKWHLTSTQPQRERQTEVVGLACKQLVSTVAANTEVTRLAAWLRSVSDACVELSPSLR